MKYKDNLFYGSYYYPIWILKQIYPDIHGRDIKTLLEENYGPKLNLIKRSNLIYSPGVGFSHKPRKGKFVSIDKNGFRLVKNQGPFPIDKSNFNIFVFGFSTTFGVGVKDNESIPSFLQEKLRSHFKSNNICVYNFGRCYYNSSQNRILFESLICRDIVPDMVLFLQGMAEPIGRPYYTAWMRYIFSQNSKSNGFFNKIRDILENTIAISQDEFLDPHESLKRWMNNMRICSAICNEYNISIYFIVLPVPNYKMNIDNHIPFKFNLEHQNKLLEVTLKLYGLLDGKDVTFLKNKKRIINLMDIQLDEKNNLYVDYCHYNSYFNLVIAENIVKNIIKNKTIKKLG